MKRFAKKFILILMLVMIFTSSICTNFYYSRADSNDEYTYKQSEPNVFLVLLSDGIIFIGELIEDLLVEALGTGLGENIVPSIESLVFNEYPITRLDFFRENVWINGEKNEFADEINSIISHLYVALLAIVIAIYVFVLVYVGIKILISSVAEEQAKFKRTLASWTIGLVLLMSFHFVMGYVIEFNDLGVNFARKVMEDAIGPNTTEDGEPIIQNLMKKFKDEAINTEYKKLNKEGIEYFQGKNPAQYVNNSNYNKYFSVFNAINSIKAVVWLALTIKIVLVAMKYIKRFLMITFLILIFPFVTICYVFDRVKDGKSHIFDIWFKTFAVNVFINFLHVIIYLIVVQLALKVTSSLGWLLPVIALLSFDKIAEQVGGLFGITKEALSSPSEMRTVVTENSKGMVNALKQRLSFSQNSGEGRISEEIKMINSMNGSYKGERPQNQLIEKVIMTSANSDVSIMNDSNDNDGYNTRMAYQNYSNQTKEVGDNTVKNIGNVAKVEGKIVGDKNISSKGTTTLNPVSKGLEDKTAGVVTQKVDMASVLPSISVNANVKANATVDMTDTLMNMFNTSSVKGNVLDKTEDTRKNKDLQEDEKNTNNDDNEFSIENVLKRAGVDVSMLSQEEKEEIYKMYMSSYQELSKEAKMQMQKKEKIQKKKK